MLSVIAHEVSHAAYEPVLSTAIAAAYAINDIAAYKAANFANEANAYWAALIDVLDRGGVLDGALPAVTGIPEATLTAMLPLARLGIAGDESALDAAYAMLLAAVPNMPATANQNNNEYYGDGWANGGLSALRPGSESLVIPPLIDEDPAAELPWLRDMQDAEESFVVPGPGSPIVLDLDGDGIEVVATASGTYFDLEADGFAQRTGWVTGGDGFLVWDRNGNGKIDNGRELFGNHTLLANGSEAANGFAALAELDANGNGILNSADAAWSNLRIWRDANQNGVTDAGELLTMSAAGVQSINTGYADWGNYDPTETGNQFRQVGSFTTTGGVSQSAVDVWFANDPVNRIETSWVVESSAVLALPNLAGYGLVHGLRQAMARDGTGVLQARVQSFVSAQTDAARDAAVDQILLAWAGSESATYTGPADQPEVPASYVSPQIVATLEKFAGSPIQIGGAPNLIGMPYVKGFLTSAYKSLHDWVYGQLAVQTFLKTDLDLIQIGVQSTTGALVHDFTALVGSLQTGIAANHETGVTRAVNVLRGIASAGTQVTSAEWAGLKTALGRFDERIDWVLESRGLTTVIGGSGADWLSYLTVVGSAPHEISNAISGAVGDDMLVGGGIADVLFGGQGNDTLNDSGGDNVFDGGQGDDLLLGGSGSDTYYFRRGSGADVITNQSSDPSLSAVDRVLLGREIAPQDVAIWRDRDNLYLQLSGSGDKLTITGHFYDQAYYSEMKIEQVAFGDGTVWGEAVFALAKFVGTAGADSIYGDLDANVLVGLGGDDYLVGDAGNDTYEFSPGFGMDLLYDTSGGLDVIRFTGGIAPSDIQVSRDGSDLFLALNASGDRIRVVNYFSIYDPGAKIEQVQFSNGTTWSSTLLDAANYIGTSGYDALQGTLASETFYGLDGDDWVSADGGDDIVYAGTGSDTVSGADGNDLISGVAGNDNIYGDEGNDTLIGGVGNDTLDGGYGNDVYRFSNGDGVDIVSYSGGTDRIEFDATVSAANVGRYRSVLETSSYVFELTNGQSITVGGWFGGPPAPIESVTFADGSVWGSSQFGNYRWLGSSASDWAYLYDQGVYVELRGGDDGIVTDAGNDILDGGTGNDSLYGGAGSDTYVFRSGYGQDTISDDAGSLDKVSFGPGIAATGVAVSRDVNHLYLSIAGTSDKITVYNYFADATYVVERFEFNDGTVWSGSTIATKLSVGTAGADFLWGTDNPESMNGLAGNDTLIGNAGNDTLTGGDGDDTLDGGYGADTMAGGAGDDTYFVDTAGDTTTEAADQGIDTVYSGVDRTLGTNLENLVLYGAATTGTGNTLDNQLIGNALNNTLSGGSGNDFLDGGAGQDAMTGGIGDDTFEVDNEGDTVIEYASEGSDTVQASITFDLTNRPNVENVILTGAGNINAIGNAAVNRLIGNGGVNVLTGGAGDDYLDGGAGADSLVGGANDDTYVVDNTGDTVTENSDEGNDTVQASITFDLTSRPNVENVTLIGFANSNATGNAVANRLTGNAGVNMLAGGAGADTLQGGGGDDRLTGDALDTALYSGGQGDYIVVNYLGETWVLDRRAGQDGADQLTGNFTLSFLGSQTTRSVATARNPLDYIAAYPDLIYYLGANEASGFNHLIANGVAEGRTITFDAAAYADTNGDVKAVYTNPTTGILDLRGLAAHYIQWGSTEGRGATLNGDEGADLVRGGIGNDWLDGRGGADNIAGEAGHDQITGGAGNDVIAGEAGFDTAIFSGNRVAYTITRVAAQNRFDILGPDGADSVTGVEALRFADSITVLASVTSASGIVDNFRAYDYLAANVDLMLVYGADTFDATAHYFNFGWAEGRPISGFDGIRYLASNPDLLPVYGANAIAATEHYVRWGYSEGRPTNSFDVVQYLANYGDLAAYYGSDLPGATAHYVNYGFAEGRTPLKLVYTGTAGNDTLTGNAAANTLIGNAGNDTLSGGIGSDTLQGGTGADVYKLARGDGADTVIENDSTTGVTDVASFAAGIAFDQLWFRMVGSGSNDLEVSVIGSSDRFTFQTWNLDSQYHVEQFKTTDGNKTLLDSQVQNLVSAMANFSPPAAGQSTLPQSTRDALNTPLAAWQ